MGFISILLIIGSLTIGTMILGDPLRADDCDDKCGAGTTCCCGIGLPKAGGVGVGGSCLLSLTEFQSLGIELINNCACVDDKDMNTCASKADCPEGQKCCCEGEGGQPRAPGSDPCSQPPPARVSELGIVKGPRRACHCVSECKKDSDCTMPQLCCCDNHGVYNKRYPEFERFCPDNWTSPQTPRKYSTKAASCQCMYSQQSRISNGTRY